MWYMHDFGGGWMVFEAILVVVFWGGVIALVVWGIKKLAGRSGSSGRTSPMDIARERYAKGEISKEQFEQIKKDL